MLQLGICQFGAGTATSSALCDGMELHKRTYAPVTFDHRRCINSGFIAESLGPLARGSVYVCLQCEYVRIFW
jgi:hypothetical protein